MTRCLKASEEHLNHRAFADVHQVERGLAVISSPSFTHWAWWERFLGALLCHTAARGALAQGEVHPRAAWHWLRKTGSRSRCQSVIGRPEGSTEAILDQFHDGVPPMPPLLFPLHLALHNDISATSDHDRSIKHLANDRSLPLHSSRTLMKPLSRSRSVSPRSCLTHNPFLAPHL